MKLNKDIILKKIEENKEKIRSFGVKSLKLFGSYAKGTQKKDSDIDFLVEFEEGRGLFDDKVGLLLMFEELFNKEIDLVKPNKIREELREYILNGEQYAAKI